MVHSDWRPIVDDSPTPLWSRLVDRLAEDIAAGRLRSGMRLPPHRELAFTLGVAIGTISRAYAEAERRGLVASHVGRGTYVADRRPIPLAHRQSEGRINLGMNIPPIGPALGVLDETLEKLRTRGDLSALFDYTQTVGLPVVREAGTRWLKEQAGVNRASPDRLIQTNGGQQALMLACSSIAQGGDIVLCDAATYPGNRTIADHGGWHLRGIPGDASGMDPAELDRIAGQTGARLVILIPTLHNPTTVTMSQERRVQIVEIARKRDLIIIEDDIYRVFGAPGSPTPLADLAPERVIHTTSLSKALAPGLRLGFILAPDNDALHSRLLLAAQAAAYCPPAINGLIFADWMDNGTAQSILDAVRAEMVRRNAFARSMLGDEVAEPGSETSLHLWLQMSRDRTRYVHEQALRANVELTPPEAPYLDPHAVMGLRVCLGAPVEYDEFEQGILRLRSVLQASHLAASRGVV